MRARAHTTRGPIRAPSHPQVVVVTSTTYANAREGFDRYAPDQRPWFHWTVHPDKTTSGSVAARFASLRTYYLQMDGRLSKLTTRVAVSDVDIMLEEAPKLVRPQHYASVLAWVRGVQTFARTQCASGNGASGRPPLAPLSRSHPSRAVRPCRAQARSTACRKRIAPNCASSP